MSYIDIAIIVIVALAAIIGFFKGAIKSSISLFGFLLALVSAFFLSKVVGDALLSNATFKGWILGESSLLSFLVKPCEALVSGNPDETSALYQLFIAPALKVIEGAGLTNLTAGQSLALYYTSSIFNLIVGVVLFIVIRILLTILLTLFLHSLTKGKKKSALARFFGLIIGAVRGALYSVVLLVLLLPVASVTTIPGMAKVNAEYETSTIAKPVMTVVQEKVVDKFIGLNSDTLKANYYKSYLNSEENDPSEIQLTGNIKTLRDSLDALVNFKEGESNVTLTADRYDNSVVLASYTDKYKYTINYITAAVELFDSDSIKDDAACATVYTSDMPALQLAFTDLVSLLDSKVSAESLNADEVALINERFDALNVTFSIRLENLLGAQYDYTSLPVIPEVPEEPVDEPEIEVEPADDPVQGDTVVFKFPTTVIHVVA